MKSWFESITFFSSVKYQEIQQFLKEERENGKSILPKEEDIFNALKLTPLQKVKVSGNLIVSF